MIQFMSWRYFFVRNYKPFLFFLIILICSALLWQRYLAGTGETAQKEDASVLKPIAREEEPPRAIFDSKYKDFGLAIPKINLDLPVVSNVDGVDRKKYKESLKKGVGQYNGTAKPDENGNVFIFGHSSDYAKNKNPYAKAFAKLPDLKEGDEVSVWYENNEYHYKITLAKVVAPTDMSWLEKSSEPVLTLMTCYPINTDKQRFIVRAKRI